MAGSLFSAFSTLPAVHPGKPDVEDDGRRPVVPHGGQALQPVVRGDHADTGTLQVQRHQLQRPAVVLDDDDHRCRRPAAGSAR